MAEGGGLLNRCTVKSCTGGSNPPLSATLLSSDLKFSCCKFVTLFLRQSLMSFVSDSRRKLAKADPVRLAG